MAPKNTPSKASGKAKPRRQTKKTAAKKSASTENKPPASSGGAPIQDFLSATPGPELVIGLVGPIGTDIGLVAGKLENELAHVGYKAVHVHVSDAFHEIEGEFELKERPIEQRYISYMDAGNKLRERLDRQDALALFSVAAIRKKRVGLTGSRIEPSTHTAYILNQLKRPEEIATLRRVYGRGFIQLSAYCSEDRRLDDLTSRIAKSYYREKSVEAYRGKAQDLISRDNDEEENPYGQRVRDTFPLADIVIGADLEENVIQMCSRFVRAFFGDNFCTPSPDEYGMHLAKATALRSSDLSRQVGAAIFAKSGEIISMGCNEVPKAGGGAYWEGDPFDFRDFKLGEDSSVRVKREIVEDVLRRLRGSGWLHKDKNKRDIDNLAEEALGDGKKGIFKDAKITNILEFGRIVHAEMSAISDAARRGVSLADATLYCNTFPCHICARHIVASGIRRVVYIEPYSKSLAAELYPDSISVDGKIKQPGPKVEFVPFIGIAPERYADIFAKGKRKDKAGKAIMWNPKHAVPILARLVPAYMQIETAVIDALAKMLEKYGVETKGG
jgi:deoxycytidylate deaminase